MASWLDWPLPLCMLALICSRVVMCVFLGSVLELSLSRCCYLSIDLLDKKAEYLGYTYLFIRYMTDNPRISLEQWRALLAVVDAGGYAQAAAVLHKSQSAVTYAVQKMEALLAVKIFEVVGRKAHLTPTGEV